MKSKKAILEEFHRWSLKVGCYKAQSLLIGKGLSVMTAYRLSSGKYSATPRPTTVEIMREIMRTKIAS